MRNRWLAMMVVIALLAWACGGSSESTDRTDTDTTEPTTEPNTAALATTEPTPEPTPTAAPVPNPESAVIVCEETTVATGDMTIAGERCMPTAADAELRPAVVVLNGCGGYEADGEVTSAIVRALAERGLIALRIDYLAAEPTPPDTYCDAAGVLTAVQPILQAVVDGVATLRADPTADPDRIGAAGYSLGALAAMGAHLGGAGFAAVEPLDLEAAALLSYPNQLPMVLDAARAGEVPPLFLMTGADDTTAPPAGAEALAMAAAEGGVPNELVLIPGQDHPWRGGSATIAGVAIADYLARQLGA